MTYEITMKRQEQGEKPNKKIAFKVVHHVKEHDNDDNDEIQDDFALITKQFQDFLWKKQGNKGFSNFKKDGNKNLVRKYLDDTSATKQDTSRLIFHFFKS
ncbi:hypothetical protein NC653_008408 [Populus alba x Populus x berolinensis]|uniref:Uncharacterized protein n=1 Tax=Populus alba x Populus x berolinensis TaxID=444605 RepID=A0AAD6W8H6_9ROSI|nr:hypothetical protein NC653_008408 [Populus alba x Populus x berolinensis]